MMGATSKATFHRDASLQPSVRNAAVVRCDISLLRIPVHRLVAAASTKIAFAAIALR